jgi:hexosaminidase
VPWDYDERADFAPQVEPLAKEGVATVVATGVWNWNEVFPHYHRTFKNINGFLAAGRKYGTRGILNTGWTDSAQTLYRMSLPGLALGAVAGWQSGPVSSDSYFAEYARQTYSEEVATEVAQALEELSGAEEMFMSALGGPTIHSFWADPLEPNRLKRLEAHEDELRHARLMANSAEEHLRRALRKRGDPTTLQCLLVAARMFDYLGMKNLYVVEWSKYFRELKANPSQELVSLYINQQIAAQDHGMLTDLMDAITQLREEYRAAWLEESTTYRLGTALGRWDAECEYWREVQARIPEVLRGRKAGEAFPAVETLRPRH